MRDTRILKQTLPFKLRTRGEERNVRYEISGITVIFIDHIYLSQINSNFLNLMRAIIYTDGAGDGPSYDVEIFWFVSLACQL